MFGGAGWFIMIAAIVVMIFLHELGHYLTAKWSGMKVTEFFLFFGPKIWSFKRGETEYGIKCIPAGAYVRIIGMSNLETDVPPEDEPRTYRQQSYPKRLLVVSAGSIMHLLQAFVLLFVAFTVVGVPGNSPLAAAARRPRARRDGVDRRAASHDGLGGRRRRPRGRRRHRQHRRRADHGLGGRRRRRSRPTPARPSPIVVLRDGETLELEATLGPAPRPRRRDRRRQGLPRHRPRRTSSCPPCTSTCSAGWRRPAQLTVELMGRTVPGLASFFTGGVDDFAADVAEGGTQPAAHRPPRSEPGSPRSTRTSSGSLSIFGIARLGAGIFEDGLFGFLILMATVNISIGLLNMIPLLPLDGGHVAIATYERIRSIGGRRYMADVVAAAADHLRRVHVHGASSACRRSTSTSSTPSVS